MAARGFRTFHPGGKIGPGICQIPGFFAEVLPFQGQLQTLVFSNEQVVAQFLLQALDLLGEGGLGNIKAGRGGGNAAAAGGFTMQGDGALLLSALCGALASCLIKLFTRQEDPVALSGWQFFLGGLVMTAIGLTAGGRLRLLSAGCIPLILYMGFISAGAYTFWGILLKYNPVSRISVLGFINPVMGVLLSALFLHENSEAFSWVTGAALGLVSLGIWIVNRAHPESVRGGSTA